MANIVLNKPSYDDLQQAVQLNSRWCVFDFEGSAVIYPYKANIKLVAFMSMSIEHSWKAIRKKNPFTNFSKENLEAHLNVVMKDMVAVKMLR